MQNNIAISDKPIQHRLGIFNCFYPKDRLIITVRERFKHGMKAKDIGQLIRACALLKSI